MGETALKQFRDRFNIPISDDQIGAAPFYKPPADSPELKYMEERREALGGYLPARYDEAPRLSTPALEVFEPEYLHCGLDEIRWKTFSTPEDKRWPLCRDVDKR